MSFRQKRFLAIATLAIVVAGVTVGQEIDIAKQAVLNAQAVEECIIPVRPGIPGKCPFWNTHSKRFIYVPAFNLEPVKDAVKYRFTATAADDKDYVFEAAEPWSALTEIWKELPVGWVVLRVEGLEKTGEVVGLAGTRRFYRAAVFKGPYHKPILDYQESARRGLKYLFELEHFQRWSKEGTVDSSYYLYCYPAKIIGAVIGSMVMYANLSPPADAGNALLIAQNAADYLIRASEPADAALAFLPPTYDASLAEFIDESNPDASYAKDKIIECQGQIMLIYLADSANAYLDLYDATKNVKFFEAAKKIADTYVKSQLPCGSWPLKVDAKTGKPITPNLCIPMRIINFLDRLTEQYGLEKYKTTSKSAFNWIMENPMNTFCWEAQFEDMPPSEQYKNLARGHVCELAGYLLDRIQENPAYLKQAEELMRFAEDQFVVWDCPMPSKERLTEKWITPCVLEQYGYYVPVDASAAKVIAVYQKAYEVTGKELYLAKACGLANTMTVVQDKNTGKYPTLWERDSKRQLVGWINCMAIDASALLNLGKMLAGKK